MGLPLIVVPTTTAPKGPRPPLELVRGDTWRYPFQIVDANTKAVLDVTGWSFWFTAKWAVPNPDAQAAIAQDCNVEGGNGGIVLVAPTQGQGIVTVLPIVTRQFADGPECMEYDIQAMDLSSIITTVERGQQIVFPDITRAITG